MRRLVGFLVALALTFSVGSVFAQSGSLPVPVSITPVGPSSGGLSTVATFDARGVGGAANAGYYSRPVLVSNNTLAGLSKGLLRRAAPVAAMALAIEAAGWAIDELTQQVYAVPPTPVGMTELNMPVWRTSNVSGCGGGCYVNSASEALALVQSKDPTAGWGGTRQFDGSAVAYVDNQYNFPAEFVLISISATQQYQRDPSAQPVPGVEPTPEQWGDLVNNNPQLWNDVLRNPDGSVNRNPDVMAEAQALANELANASPSPDPTSEWDSGNQGGDPQYSPASIEFPNFCQWASVVCSAIDWFREPPEPSQDVDMPQVDLPAPSGWVSSLGQGSCPAPHIINLNLGTQVYEWDPWCDLAARIKPLVIASAAFAALLILAGVSRRGDGNA